MKFHTFYTNNLSEQLAEDHKKVCNKIGIEVQYHSEEFIDYDSAYTAHGKFMTSVMEQEEVACFLDIDCLPHNKHLLEKAYSWAVTNNSFVGNAQNISHTQMRNHIYAAASCLIVTKNAWNTLGSPDFSWFMQNGVQIDTAQLLSLRADQIGMPYQLMYPIGYDGKEEYKLSGYGMYGRGTLYPATWHYFRISDFNNEIPDLWTTRVNNILEDQKIIPHHSSCFYEL
jgi:ABC-type transport system substrate-binding protein